MTQQEMYTGKEETRTEPIALHAGPLEMLYEGGDLRAIRLGGVEVLRRVYVAVRDRNWGTVPPVFTEVQIEPGDGSFEIRYTVENRQGDIAFAWRGTIRGEAGGAIVFTMEGEALTTFLKNRIGFCVLHPASAAGKRCVVQHSGGGREEATLPVDISSDQPVLPFADLRVLSYEALPGVWLDVTLEGDVFEMEDQRNWTDASYKTFCTPLALPYPAEMRAGERVSQRVTVRVRTERPGTPLAAPAQAAEEAGVRLSLEAGGPWAPLPALGVGRASHGQPLTPREVERLRALRLDHLRVDLPPAGADPRGPLAEAAEEARALDCGLEMALFVPEEADNGWWKALREALEAVKPPVRGWLVYPVREKYAGGSPTRQAVMAARQHLRGWLEGAPLASGSDADFIFLQRTPQPVDLIDRVAVSINPQVHAFDDLSLLETLEAQPAVVRSARRHAGGRPVVVTPVTLKPRGNAYATGAVPEVPPGQLPPQVDPRQVSLFAAGWTLGSLVAMVAGGADSVTYYETTGWRGLMEVESGSPLPGAFRSVAGRVYPLYHVLADAAPFAGAVGCPLFSSRPQSVSALALRGPAGARLLLANHTARPLTARVEGLPGDSARLRCLDERSYEEAAARPEAFRAQSGDLLAAQDGQLAIPLLPYAYACLDLLERPEP